MWKRAIDVIASTGEFDVGGAGRLNFYVNDIGNGRGPTGLIFAGTATMVPEPGALGLLSLGLVGLGFARRARKA